MTSAAWGRFCGWAAVAGIAVGTVLALAGQVAVGGVVGGTIAFAMGLAWLMVRAQVAREARSARAIEAGEYLVHWRYTPAEWRDFSAARLARTGKSARLMPVWFGLGGLVGTLGSGASLVVVGAGTLGLAALGWLIGGVLMRQAQALGDAVTLDSYISRDAVLVAGRVTAIAGGGTHVERMRLLDGAPRVLEISLRHGSGSERAYSTVQVPVPAGGEAEAEEVLRRFGFGAGLESTVQEGAPGEMAEVANA